MKRKILPLALALVCALPLAAQADGVRPTVEITDNHGIHQYTDAAGEKPYAYLPDAFTFALEDGGRGHLVQEGAWHGGACRFTWRPVRPIPEEDDFFENVWRAYRENGNIDA